MQFEIAAILAEVYSLSQKSGGIIRVFDEMKYESLIETKVINFMYRKKLTLIQLKNKGLDFCNSFGWTPIPSNLSLLESYGHRKEKEQAQILQFAYQAKIRGWEVEFLPKTSAKICPQIIVKKFDPDFIYYTEIPLFILEGLSENLFDQQQVSGKIGICTEWVDHSSEIAGNLISMEIKGYATDFTTLILDNKYFHNNKGDLWKIAF
jgi:hypothetical protein